VKKFIQNMVQGFHT
jgi:hypothetical protein